MVFSVSKHIWCLFRVCVWEWLWWVGTAHTHTHTHANVWLDTVETGDVWSWKFLSLFNCGEMGFRCCCTTDHFGPRSAQSCPPKPHQGAQGWCGMIVARRGRPAVGLKCSSGCPCNNKIHISSSRVIFPCWCLQWLDATALHEVKHDWIRHVYQCNTAFYMWCVYMFLKSLLSESLISCMGKLSLGHLESCEAFKCLIVKDI